MNPQIPNNGHRDSSKPAIAPPSQNFTTFYRTLAGFGLLLAGLLVVGTLPRLQRKYELEANASGAKSEGMTVNVVTPKRGKAKAELTLPGSIQAVKETTIYARTNGYLKQRPVGMGDRVEAGQLLAEIDVPETDQDLEQTRANFAQTQSAYAQARATLE
jgi:multidrug efflux pump subunit AcrA (membrane-fusion protein)